MKKFVNLCPHDVNLVGENGLNITFKMSGQIARVKIETEKQILTTDIAEGISIDIPTQVTKYGTADGLPEPAEGVVYIVSNMVAQVVRRPDVVAPITDATAIRDENGRVVGVKGFQSYA